MLSKQSYALARHTIKGDARELGRQLGALGAPSVRDYLVHSTAWATVQKWQGSEIAQTMMALTKKRLPHLWEELLGLAEGLEQPIDSVFLWNARGDLWAMAPDGCTTIMSPGAQPRITHNEDGDPGFAGSCAIVQFEHTEANHFASFVYPGSLPGHTLAVNEQGLAMTVNNIRALAVKPGLPRMLLTREILNQKTTQQAVDLLLEQPKAGAFHLNLLDARGDLRGLEYSSHYCAVRTVHEAVLHANHAIFPATRDWPQIITPSSGYRQVRGDAFIQHDHAHPLRILADQSEETYPIFRRSADDVDNENTLATADMRLQDGGIVWQVYEHPLQAPVYTLHNAKFRD